MVQNQMTEKEVAFENLKKAIIKKTENSLDIEKVKEAFAPAIKSARKLYRIKTLNEVFDILEVRAALDAKNVCTLEYLANLLQNEEIRKLIQGYKKLYSEPDDGLCPVCGEDIIIPLPAIDHDKNFSENENDELELAFQSIARNIGRNWRVLASELEIPECYVDEVREKYPSDLYQQALCILHIWREYYQEAATMDVLEQALDSRLCTKKGVGLHMLKPAIRIEKKC